MHAVASPWTKGRIYVTCPTEIDAPLLIRYYTATLSSVYAHRRITRIPDSDRKFLVDHLNRSVKFDETYPVGCWVKIRYGLYRGDVARVYMSSTESDEISLQVIPRFADKSTLITERVGSRKRSDRPPQRLFHAEQATPYRSAQMNADGTCTGPIPDTYCLWSNVFFRNGLQFLRVQGIHYIKHYQPTVHEILLFTIAKVDTLKETNAELLQTGDRVRGMKSAEMLDVDGVVISKSEDTVYVKYLMDLDGAEEVALALGDVRRVFTAGDVIEVCVGELRGCSGFVLDVPDDSELTFIDMCTKQQVSSSVVIEMGRTLND